MATTQDTRTDQRARIDEKVDRARPVETRTAAPASGIEAARERFGGIDIPASLVGMLTALSTTLIIAGLIGAGLGAVDYTTGFEGDAADLAVGSLVGGVAVLLVAYLIGGWAAGRIARYDGARNGFAAGIWTLVLAGILTGPGWLSGDLDVFRNVNLPQWFSTDDFTTKAVIGGAAAIAAMFVGGIVGGLWGERYHRRADRTITTPSIRT